MCFDYIYIFNLYKMHPNEKFSFYCIADNETS